MSATLKQMSCLVCSSFFALGAVISFYTAVAIDTTAKNADVAQTGVLVLATVSLMLATVLLFIMRKL